MAQVVEASAKLSVLPPPPTQKKESRLGKYIIKIKGR
jgi:hypothetical protein